MLKNGEFADDTFDSFFVLTFNGIFQGFNCALNNDIWNGNLTRVFDIGCSLGFNNMTNIWSFMQIDCGSFLNCRGRNRELHVEKFREIECPYFDCFNVVFVCFVDFVNDSEYQGIYSYAS